MSKAYLITWNPKKWDFEGGYKSFLNVMKSGRCHIEPWTVCSSSIEKGDVLYLMRLGGEPRGIIAKGISMDAVHYDKHYDTDLAEAGVTTKHVNVKFVSAGDYDNGEYIDWKELKKKFPDQNWTPQSSGISIKDKYIVELEDLWDGIGGKQLQLKDIKHNLVIIKINKSYHQGMTERELYEYTRGFWKRRIESVTPAEYALSVVDSIVMEVYKINQWLPAAQVDNMIRKYDPVRYADRIAFDGFVASADIRNYYLGRDVATLYKWGEADPVKLFYKHTVEDKNDDINIPILPRKTLRNSNGTIKYICDRCGTSFAKSARCPECGQLVKE